VWISWSFNNSQKSTIKTYLSSAIEYEATRIVHFPPVARTIRPRRNRASVTDVWKSAAVADISSVRSAMFSDIPILIGALHTKRIGIFAYASSGLK
jgi:hypothetical protein